jgi:23S rRNA pseudouridine2605 synthase
MRKKRSQSAPAGDAEPESELSTDGLVRLNKFMADLGVASRRKCDEMIVAGKVSIDGQPTVELGTKIDPERQSVDVNGVILKPLGVRKRYYLLNKPRGVVCTNEVRETRMRAIDMITDRNKGRIFSVGRLDEDSSGLLLLTNDGEFTNQIAHPRHSVPKTYLVKVRGRIEDTALARITEGVRLSEGRTSGAAIHVERRANEATVLTITIREGKNREIRRVFAAMGYKVVRLHRVRIGALSDRRLKDGEWRPLTVEEVADLLDVAHNKQRAEELFQGAGHGTFIRPFSESGDNERPTRTGRDRESSARTDGGERTSRFGGTRRDWHEPKDFRIKSTPRKPRPKPGVKSGEDEPKPERSEQGLGARGARGGRGSAGRGGTARGFARSDAGPKARPGSKGKARPGAARRSVGGKSNSAGRAAGKSTQRGARRR